MAAWESCLLLRLLAVVVALTVFGQYSSVQVSDIALFIFLCKVVSCYTVFFTKQIAICLAMLFTALFGNERFHPYLMEDLVSLDSAGLIVNMITLLAGLIFNTVCGLFFFLIGRLNSLKSHSLGGQLQHSYRVCVGDPRWKRAVRYFRCGP